MGMKTKINEIKRKIGMAGIDPLGKWGDRRA